MKNIAIIISSLKGGGAERVVSNITMNLSQEKYNIYLILFDSSCMKYPYSGNLIDLDIKAKNNPSIKVINFIRRYFKIREAKKRYKIDTSISFLGGPNLLNILTNDKENVIISVRGYPSTKSKNLYSKVDKYIMKKIYNKADIVIGVSNLIKNDLIKNYNINKEKVLTIYNPYDLQKIDKLSNEIIESEYRDIFEAEVVITVGRLTHLKGHWHLIRSFKKNVDINKDIKLVIIGEGELREYLQGLINDLNLNNSVYLLGFKSNVYKYIKNSSLFLLPSLSEGFPNALAEAMACKVPVIASDCKSGPREILAPETDVEFQCKGIELAQHGVLIPVCDGRHYNYDDSLTNEENIMADSILMMLDDKKLHENYTRKSIIRVKDFKIDRIIKEWEEII